MTTILILGFGGFGGVWLVTTGVIMAIRSDKLRRAPASDKLRVVLVLLVFAFGTGVGLYGFFHELLKLR